MKTGWKNYLEGVLGASALLLDWRVAVAEPSVRSSSLSADRGRSDVEAEGTSFTVNESKYIPSLLDLKKLTVGHALLLHGEISLLLLLEGLLELDVFLVAVVHVSKDRVELGAALCYSKAENCNSGLHGDFQAEKSLLA